MPESMSGSAEERRIALIGVAAALLGVLLGSLVSGYFTTKAVDQQIDSSQRQAARQSLFEQRAEAYRDILNRYRIFLSVCSVTIRTEGLEGALAKSEGESSNAGGTVEGLTECLDQRGEFVSTLDRALLITSRHTSKHLKSMREQVANYIARLRALLPRLKGALESTRAEINRVENRMHEQTPSLLKVLREDLGADLG